MGTNGETNARMGLPYRLSSIMKKVQAKDHPVRIVMGLLLKIRCHALFFELTHQVVFVLRRKSPCQVDRFGVVRRSELYHGFVCARLG